MKICVFGAGAIGGHLAARLAKGGADTSLIARGPQLAAIQAHGLRVTTPEETIHVHPRAAATAAELGPQDAVIVTTKQTALPSVAAAIGPLLGPDTSVSFVMNGIPWWYFDHEGGPHQGKRLPLVDPGDAMRGAVGVERTLGGVIWSACTIIEPGVIQVATKGDRLILGEPDGSLSPRARAVAEAFKAGGMGCRVSDDIRQELWLKLIGNLANGPLCTAARQNIKAMLADPVLRQASLRCMAEGIAIARALGVTIDMDPEARLAASGGTAHRPSILQDLDARRPMEIKSLFDMPLEMARELGVPTPTLDLCVALVRQQALNEGIAT